MLTYYMVTKFWEEKSDVLVVSLVCSPLGLAAWFLDIVNERMAPPRSVVVKAYSLWDFIQVKRMQSYKI